jgi:hypothetical protein
MRVVELSAVGMRLETLDWMALDRRYDFRLGRERLAVAGKVVRCMLVRVRVTDDGASAVYQAGVSFERALDEKELHRLLAASTAVSGDPLAIAV